MFLFFSSRFLKNEIIKGDVLRLFIIDFGPVKSIKLCLQGMRFNNIFSLPEVSYMQCVLYFGEELRKCEFDIIKRRVFSTKSVQSQ